MIQQWMIQQWKRIGGYTLAMGLAIVTASTFMACSFNPPGLSEDPRVRIHQMLNMAPDVKITEGQRWTVYDDPGKFRVVPGYSCAEAPYAVTEDTLGPRVQAAVLFPSAAYEGTEFLNGRKAEYLGNGDHEVVGLGSAVFWLYTLGLNVSVFSIRSRPLPPGTILGLVSIAYVPGRFLLDCLRLEDARYAGLSPGQYFSVALLAFGLWIVANEQGKSAVHKALSTARTAGGGNQRRRGSNSSLTPDDPRAAMYETRTTQP